MFAFPQCVGDLVTMVSCFVGVPMSVSSSLCAVDLEISRTILLQVVDQCHPIVVGPFPHFIAAIPPFLPPAFVQQNSCDWVIRGEKLKLQHRLGQGCKYTHYCANQAYYKVAFKDGSLSAHIDRLILL